MSSLPDPLPAPPLLLRRWQPSYAGALVEAVELSFPELHAWMPWAAARPDPDGMRLTLERGEQAFLRDEGWAYVLLELDGGAVVGSADLRRRPEPGAFEIGYWVRSDRTRRGYASATAGALTRAAFAALPSARRVEIRMDEANRASAAVPAKLGFRLRGREPRQQAAPAETGWGLVWVAERDRWRPPDPRAGA